jgi:predicted Zn finger-like uncharacterized protein
MCESDGDETVHALSLDSQVDLNGDTTNASKDVTYVMCSSCKSAYIVSKEEIGRGARLECAVCEKQWYQTGDRVMSLYDDYALRNMTQADEDNVKTFIEERGFPRTPLNQRFGIFVGNLPYSFDESDILGTCDSLICHTFFPPTLGVGNAL